MEYKLDLKLNFSWKLRRNIHKDRLSYMEKASGESGKLANHAKTQMHILSMERMQNFKSDNQHIDVQLVGIAEASKTRKEQEREENRQIVQTIFDVVRHLAKQNTAFRGHNETSDSANHGNFLEELLFLSKYDKPLKRWMETHPQNLSYFSPSIQNEMIGILSNMIIEIIKSEVISAKYTTIECDEVTSHKRAFMSVIVRYVYDYCIWERCIKLHRVTNLTGQSLAAVIIAILANMDFPICNLVGKGFDGQVTCQARTKVFNNISPQLVLINRYISIVLHTN